MKSRLLDTIICTIILLFFSGGLILHGQEKIIDISNHWEDTGNYPLSRIGESIEYIPLETTPSCLIGPAHNYRYKIVRDTIYLTRSGHPVYVFDLNGKFVRRIGQVGKGPQEFVDVTSFAIDKNENRIWISDRKVGKILIYSTDGSFVSQFKRTKGSYKLFSNLNGGVSRLYRGFELELKQNEIQDFDKDSTIINRIPLYEVDDYKEHRRSVALSTVSILDGQMRIMERPSSQEYLWSDGSWEKTWKIIASNGTIIKIRGTNKHFFIQSANPMVHQYIAEKATGRVFVCSFGVDAIGPDAVGAYNDLDGGLSFWPKDITENGDMVCMYEAYDIISYANGQSSTWGGKPPKMTAEFKEFADQLSIDDNPVIVIVRHHQNN
ncbi:MAG: 6-bladed beta-propeller [Bacteroidota bacterium]|nr:6-bladed beta-propeller [Bacteroidota bacterium]